MKYAIITMLLSILLYICLSIKCIKSKSELNEYSVENTVPKILHRTLLWDSEIPSDIKSVYDKFNSTNACGWQIKLWNDDDVRKLMEKYDLLSVYDSYTLKIQKADFARYVIVYAEGGCYCDFDIESTYSLNDILKLHNTDDKHNLTLITECCYSSMPNNHLFCNRVLRQKPYTPSMTIRLNDINNKMANEEPHRIANYFLMANKHSSSLWDLIKLAQQRSTLNVKNQYDVLYTTGPALVSSFYYIYDKKENINILHTRYLRHLATGSWRTQIPR
jgi:hypothetical protein